MEDTMGKYKATSNGAQKAINRYLDKMEGKGQRKPPPLPERAKEGEGFDESESQRYGSGWPGVEDYSQCGS
jgi:hypothetical protein